MVCAVFAVVLAVGYVHIMVTAQPRRWYRGVIGVLAAASWLYEVLPVLWAATP